MNRVLILIVAAASAVEAARFAQTTEAARIDVAAARVADGQLRTHVPGLSLAVARNGALIFARGYGMADLESGTDSTPDTLYRIRSLTKQFTAAAIMRLVEAGKVALDDPIVKYLPDYPTQGHTVTVRHLLTHTSGLTTESSRIDLQTALSGGVRQWFKLDLSYKDMVERFGPRPFSFAPGERWEYNNLGYYLLGEIVGRASGMPYKTFVEQELLAPHGLDRTYYCDDHRVLPRRAAGYEHYDGRIMNAPYVAIAAVEGGAGVLCSTVEDLVRWTHLLFGGQIVSRESLRAMTTPVTLADGKRADYGFGLYVATEAGRRKVYHGGARPGFSGYMSHYPDDGLTIVVLNNLGGGRERAAELEKAIAAVVFGGGQQGDLAAEEFRKYEGTYVLEAGGRTLEVRVFVEDRQLKAQASGQAVINLQPRGDRTFVSTIDPDIRVVFTMGTGQAEGLTLYQRGQTIPGRRKR